MYGNMKLIDALKEAKELLKQNEIDEREARLLLAFVLQVRKEELITFKEISEEQYKEYREIVSKRCNGVPYAYIVGHKEFMGLDFLVNENVLIPRDDTEVLVEKVLEIIKSKKDEAQSLRILDMCTGSGCIAISLAHLSNCEVVAVDKSSQALEVAKENANKNNVNITFVESDLFESLSKENKFDIIVSNPPYIKKKVIDTLQKEVKEHEPMMALDGGEDGLFFYKKIASESKKYLTQNGVLAFEIGYDQADDVRAILENEKYGNIEVTKDLSNNDRVIIAQII